MLYTRAPALIEELVIVITSGFESGATGTVPSILSQETTSESMKLFCPGKSALAYSSLESNQFVTVVPAGSDPAGTVKLKALSDVEKVLVAVIIGFTA